MATYLPEEMVVKILSLLPPKSLIRFKCVSKRWHALIGNPDFLSKNLLNHSILTQNPCDPLHLTLFIATDISDPRKQIHSFRSYDSLRCASQTPLNLPPAPPRFNVVASCNGLLCLWDELRSDLYLWNPATSSELKALPAAPSRCRGEPRPAIYDWGFYFVGFGFDSVSNDLKVVTLVDADDYGCLEAEIYSLKSGCWRPLDMSVNFELGLVPQGAALDGVFLWYDDVVGRYTDDRIVAFDFSEEEFATMTFPVASFFCDNDKYTRTLTKLKGTVAMVLFPRQEEFMYLDIWVMVEFGVTESWTRLLGIELPLHLEWPLGFWKNGELFMQNSEGQVVLYDLLAQTETNLQFEGYRGTIKVVDYTLG
ncbi:F-box/kelch-repeat protein At3g06240-like [Corylus avellana]|uniref:F-box/kelch-repeat protein At3g06240-like n=1 Tax=Corylus avellana TaxID=13451 RepID=UPI001E22D29F|nr:F-box/kelch-repeat protein At3g06240-like [Corylus avellana]XP_059430042.1 F-box/kelch-repeat protein At3g06240-like [Corylus avellana]